MVAHVAGGQFLILSRHAADVRGSCGLGLFFESVSVGLSVCRRLIESATRKLGAQIIRARGTRKLSPLIATATGDGRAKGRWALPLDFLFGKFASVLCKNSEYLHKF